VPVKARSCAWALEATNIKAASVKSTFFMNTSEYMMVIGE
jgi:hypothetical protein